MYVQWQNKPIKRYEISYAWIRGVNQATFVIQQFKSHFLLTNSNLSHYSALIGGYLGELCAFKFWSKLSSIFMVAHTRPTLINHNFWPRANEKARIAALKRACYELLGMMLSLPQLIPSKIGHILEVSVTKNFTGLFSRFLVHSGLPKK